MKTTLITSALLLTLSLSASAADAPKERQFVKMPPMMVEHMMGNMRDHLLALQEITRNLSIGEYDAAADIAEARLGMSSMDDHGAHQMGKIMPRQMGAIGTLMHKSASRFAKDAREADVDGGLAKAFGSLSKVMQQCVACHNGFRVH